MWASFTEPVKKFCNGEEDRVLKFVCSDWNRMGPKLIGEYTTSLRELRDDYRNHRPKTLMNNVSQTLKKKTVRTPL